MGKRTLSAPNQERVDNMKAIGFPKGAITREGMRLWFEQEGISMMIGKLYELADTNPDAFLKHSTAILSYVMPKAIERVEDEKSYIINIVAPDSFKAVPSTNPTVEQLYAAPAVPPQLDLPSIDDLPLQ